VGTLGINTSSVIGTGLGLIAVVVAVFVFLNRQILFITSDRSGFLALAVIGFAMCAVAGIGNTQATLGWTHPVTFAGIILGVTALGLVVVVLTGHSGFLTPLGAVFSQGTVTAISGDRLAFYLLAGVILIKWILGYAYLALR
jgi:hypothetical protein